MSIKGQGHSLTLIEGHSDFKVKTCSFVGCPSGCLDSFDCTDEKKGIFVDVRYFQLGYVNIPSDVEERFLRALTLQEDALKEQLLQDAQIVRKDTDFKVCNLTDSFEYLFIVFLIK